MLSPTLMNFWKLSREATTTRVELLKNANHPAAQMLPTAHISKICPMDFLIFWSAGNGSILRKEGLRSLKQGAGYSKTQNQISLLL